MAGEMHLVHVNEDYPEIGDALGNPDGLAVMGFLFDVTLNRGRATFSVRTHPIWGI